MGQPTNVYALLKHVDVLEYYLFCFMQPPPSLSLVHSFVRMFMTVKHCCSIYLNFIKLLIIVNESIYLSASKEITFKYKKIQT